MMMSDDDDVEPQLNVLKDYYLLDAADQPVCFSVLPFQFKDTDEVPECKKSVFLWGTADPGIKVYKKVVAWKLGLEGKQPEIAVLSAEGSWICLVKPKNSYEGTIRTILITVQMLHFLRRKPEESEKNLRIHLHKVFDKFDVRPSEDDIRNHRSLVKQFAEKDSTLAKSEILRAFIEERSRKKNSEVGSDNVGIKESFIADDGDIEEMVESDEEEEEDLFDSICAICDNGGDLLCCDGPCMRSFHAKVGTGEDSYCETLGYTEAEVEAMKNFLCKNCEYKKHQCFICGVLEPSDGPTAKVFLCNNATCGHFYHPKCVAQQLHPHNRNEALELEKKITDGFSFTCPIHWCFRCKSLEDRTQEHLQFAVCRRCPKSYHRKCLPREISFKDIEEEDIVTRAWELSKRILIYCLDHEIDSDIDTPVRNHIKFPRIPSIEKPTKFVKKSTKVLFKNKKRTFTGSIPDQPSKKPAKSPYKVRVQEGEHARKFAAKSLSEQLVDKPDKKKVMSLEERTQPVPNMVKDASISSPKPANEQERLLPSSTTRKIPQSSFPMVDNETEKRVHDLVEKEVSSLTLKDVSRKCLMPSTHAYSGRQIDRIIAKGKLERSVQAVGAALKMLENGGNVNDAKAVCEPEVLRQLAKWHSKLRVYISPFIYGTRYSSFGRHFTKVEKLAEIVDKLHWYVEPGDMIVDFCCGANDFCRLMKEKLDQVQKKCHFKNYDLIQPQNCFCFERRDWMTVQPKELPRGSQLIMGLNPPFGVRAALANKFIDKALTFKPKLIILIVPEETKRLDQKKTPYDLVWEDSECLAGKAFYLPGSVDVNDKIVEGWNASAPPLYLWSHPDWTKKHRKVAEEHNHTSIGKIASHVEEGNLLDDPCPPVKKEAEPSGISNSRSGKEIENTGKTSCHLNEANLSDDLTVRKQAEAINKQNIRSGKQKETTENTACNVREASLSDGRPVKKQARSEEEKSKDANLSDNLPVKNEAEAAFQQISQSGKEKEGRDEGKRSHDRSRKRTPDQVDSLPPEKQVEVAYEERRVIPRKRSINQEDKRDPCCGDGINARREESKRGDSDMNISSPDTSNARNRSPFVPSEYTDRTVHPDSYTSYLAKEPHISTFRSATYQGSYLARRNGYNDTLEGKNDATFYTNADDSSRKHSSSIEELTKQYAAAPTGDVYGLQSLGDDGSFCRRQSSEEWKTNYAERNAAADVHCSRYSGQIGDGYLQTGIPPTTVAQAHIRIHGRPSADDYPQINRYSLGSSGARFGQPALTSPSYGFSGTTAPLSSVLDMYAPGFLGPTGLRSSVMDKYAPGVLGQSAPGGLVMDKYAPSLKETNYTTRGVHDVPRHGRDMPADSMSLEPPQYPYQRPGSSVRGPPHN